LKLFVFFFLITLLKEKNQLGTVPLSPFYIAIPPAIKKWPYKRGVLSRGIFLKEKPTSKHHVCMASRLCSGTDLFH
jgi:hypothetical protein